MATSPELVIACGEVRATIEPHEGGRLAQLEIGGRRFLREREEREHAWGYWGSYPLIPWSNRIADARFRFGGRTWQLDERWVDGTAIHGLVCRRPWDVVDVTATSVTISIGVDTPPWQLACVQDFTVDANALTQRIAVTNVGDEPAPVGIGVHPWFPTGLLQVPADLIWPAVDCMPTGPPRPVGPDEDLRAARRPPAMDECYTGLTGTKARVGDLELRWRGPVQHVVVYTGDPGWMCVEPVTNANDGFNLFEQGRPDTGVVVLEPGASTEVVYELSLRAPG